MLEINYRATSLPARTTFLADTCAVPPNQTDRFEPTSSATAGAPSLQAAKTSLIRSMVARSPDEDTTNEAISALSVYPLRALQIVANFGTRLEFYDLAAGEKPPDYMEPLKDPDILGGYHAQANRIGMDRHNARAFTLLHEFGHALDAAMNHLSEQPAVVNAQARARAENRTVRDNARKNPQEYLADNLAAYLIDDEALPALIEDARHSNPLITLDRQDYSHDRLHRKDPAGFEQVQWILTQGIYKLPPAPRQQ